MKQFEPVGLHSVGKILLSLRLDGFQSEPALETNVSTRQQASAAEPVEKRIALPMHNAPTSTALGDALDGGKSDPKETGRRLHANWGHAPAQQPKRTMAEAGDGGSGGAGWRADSAGG